VVGKQWSVVSGRWSVNPIDEKWQRQIAMI
jgi:hypothetical protein